MRTVKESRGEGILMKRLRLVGILILVSLFFCFKGYQDIVERAVSTGTTTAMDPTGLTPGGIYSFIGIAGLALSVTLMFRGQKR